MSFPNFSSVVVAFYWVSALCIHFTSPLCAVGYMEIFLPDSVASVTCRDSFNCVEAFYLIDCFVFALPPGLQLRLGASTTNSLPSFSFIFLFSVT